MLRPQRILHFVFFLAVVLPTASLPQVVPAVACDSALFHLSDGRTTNARKWISLALSSATATEDLARTHGLLGMIEEEEGYLLKAQDAYLQAFRESTTTNASESLAAALLGLASISST